MTTETAHSGIREIDTGALPDRYARGWHCLGPVKDFLDGQPHGIEIFGTMLVVFADSQGELKVLDGYCRHMGGNLSQGTIKGDEVACPFHDWRWGGDGKCKLVPYAKRTPRLARTRSWETDVRGGLLFVWHDHEGNPPQPEVRIPEIPEFASDEWTDWRWNTMLIEGSNCREIIDNVTDMAHFFYIHYGLPTYFKNVFEGHIASQYLHNVGRPDINDMGTTYGEAHLDSEASYFGPSFMINWLHNNYGGFKAESILINCHYPVSQDSFMLQWGVIVEKPKGLDEATTDKLAQVFTEGVSKGFLQDVEIWKHKTRIDNPLLVEEDGAVYQMRRWYQQFYVDVADVAPDMTDRFEIEVDTTVGQREVACGGRGEPQAPGRREGRGRRARSAHPGFLMTAREDAPDVDRLARSMVLLHGGHDDDDEHPVSDEWRRILVQGTGFRIRSRPRRRGACGHPAGPGTLPHLGADAGGLPVLPRHRRRQEAGPGIHSGAVEFGSVTALCLLRRDPRRRRQQQPGAVMPTAGRQHQARGRRRLPRSGLQRPLPRRRLDLPRADADSHRYFANRASLRLLAASVTAPRSVP